MNQTLIEQHRYWNVDHDKWYEFVEEQFRDDMQDLGVRVDKMAFSGFCSQGDGACFEGAVNDWGKFLTSLGYTDPVLIQHARDSWYFGSVHSGRGNHEYSVHFDSNLPMPDPTDDEDDMFMFCSEFSPYATAGFKTAAWLAVLKTVCHVDFEQILTDAFRDAMQTLYSNLEQEYDYLTSDEAVWESLLANDLVSEEDLAHEA